MKNYLTQRQVKAIAKTYNNVMDLNDFCNNLYCKQIQQGIKEPLTYSWGYNTKTGKTQIEQLQTKDKQFKQFNTLASAKNIANGLCYNGYYAYVVTSIIPLDNLTNEQLNK